MKFILLALFALTLSINAFAQFEITTGYAVNKNLADGLPLHAGYDIQIKNRLYTKTQAGHKYLYHYNDFVGAVLKVSIFELHQTFSYEVVRKKKYIFKPNVGVNYRFYRWKGKMKPPYETLPQRAYNLEFRDDKLRLNSFDNAYSDEYNVNNLGFSFQLQSQFKINNKIWLHLTPFLEPDYDGSQNTGGCYVGVIFKSL
jgi:hypothetical protein